MNTLQIKNLTIGEGSPKIIVPLVSTTKEELLQEAQVVKELKARCSRMACGSL